MEAPTSCDTFVVLPPLTKHGVVFGKNSDRPNGEVQEVVYVPSRDLPKSVECTYITVDGHEGPTKAVILSKPVWMWGAEMGANEDGVVIGNEAVWTNDTDGVSDPKVKRLLGMDLVRLGLERSGSADEALEVVTQLLEKYGQGGPCSESDSEFSYHNSFLIADSKVAWVLETSGKHWVAEKVTSGYRNISNVLTIQTKYDKCSEGLLEYAKSKHFWNGQDEFNFAVAFSSEQNLQHCRLEAGKNLLTKFTSSNEFRETDMFAILRDTESDICRPRDSAFPTQGSQVSVLNGSRPSVHWFTATPDPSKSVFKPFVFTPRVVISKYTYCADDRRSEPHLLYSLHREAISSKGNVQSLLRQMETDCVKELEQVVENGRDLSEFDELFKDCVETEVKFYR